MGDSVTSGVLCLVTKRLHRHAADPDHHLWMLGWNSDAAANPWDKSRGVRIKVSKRFLGFMSQNGARVVFCIDTKV